MNLDYPGRRERSGRAGVGIGFGSGATAAEVGKGLGRDRDHSRRAEVDDGLEGRRPILACCDFALAELKERGQQVLESGDVDKVLGDSFVRLLLSIPDGFDEFEVGFIIDRTSSRTSRFIVAENIIVWRSTLSGSGSNSWICWISGQKPWSISRSASSRTNVLRLGADTPLLRSERISFNRPGVPTSK